MVQIIVHYELNNFPKQGNKSIVTSFFFFNFYAITHHTIYHITSVHFTTDHAGDFGKYAEGSFRILKWKAGSYCRNYCCCL